MSTPEPGQKNRSSPNFKFLDVPAKGEISTTFIAVDNPSAVLATLMQDKRLGNDVIVSLLTQNGSFPASKVNTEDNYYIASPEDVSSNFVVNFEGDV